MAKTALLIGATGLVGGYLLQQLLDSPQYDRVVAFTRKPLPDKHPKYQNELIDFDQPDASKIKGDDLFSAMGTTINKAGSKDAQYKVDCIYPATIGLIGRQNGVQQYLLVSALGANADASNFYLRTKGDLENKIKDLGFPLFVSARPSLLLGNRSEFRLGEKIGMFMEQMFRPVIPKKYRGVHAEKVARALIHLANQDLKGTHMIESDRLQQF